MIHSESLVTKISVLVLGVLLLATLFVAVPATAAASQPQSVVVSPAYINLGMKTTITVTAPTAGTYAVLVQSPTGNQFTLNETFTSAGQSENATFGNATLDFKALVNQVGTYSVHLEQGGQVVSTTSFSVTNKLNVFMDMVDGGNCIYINGATRGVKMFPRFYISYASTGAPFTNNTVGAYATYTLPNGTAVNATWHKPNTVSQSSVGFFIGKYQINWNDTYVGPWNPNATVGDGAGNIAKYHYIGVPFVISPATLSTSITLVNSKTNQTLDGLTNGTSVTVYAVISYPAAAEPVPGFVGPLDTTNRGGSVDAVVGWGYYNVTSGSFGSARNPGGQIAKVSLTYTGKNGVWEGNFSSNSVPAIKTGTSYEVVVNSQDKASPPNTGFATLSLAPASAQVVTTSTQATTSGTQTPTSGFASIPVWAFAAETVALIVGVLIGFLARRPKS
ncbi:MAG: hypothetical protein JRN20_04605 [Nitrososphaerota archaeon]|nr:hypothetical protein [Nitrososphaerota archaeon]